MLTQDIKEEELVESNSIPTQEGSIIEAEREPLHTDPLSKINPEAANALKNTLAPGEEDLKKWIEFNKNVLGFTDVVKASFWENKKKADMKVKTMASDSRKLFNQYVLSDYQDYRKTLAYREGISSDDPVVVASHEARANEDDAKREIYDKTFTYEHSVKRQQDLADLALRKELVAEKVDILKTGDVHTLVPVAAQIIGGVGDYVEVVKGMATSKVVGVVGAAYKMGAFMESGLDIATGMADNYFTAGYENDKGLENYTEKEKLKQAAIGGVVQGGLGGARHVLGTYVNPRIKEFFTAEAKKAKSNVVHPVPGTEEIKVDLDKIRKDVMDDYNNAPKGTTEVIESVVNNTVEKDGTIKYSAKEDVMINTADVPVQKIVSLEGEVMGHSMSGRYKNQDITVEIPKVTAIDAESSASRVSTLKLFEESKQTVIYSTDADGKKIELVGADKQNAYLNTTISTNTVLATTDSIIEKGKAATRDNNTQRVIARIRNGSDAGVNATKDVSHKISYGHKKSIEKTLRDGILAPMERGQHQAKVEFDTRVGQASAMYQGQPLKMAKSFEPSQFSRWFINGIEDSSDKKSIQVVISDYSDLGGALFSSSKGKKMQLSGEDLTGRYGQIFYFESNTNTVELSEGFKANVGRNKSDAAIDLVLNQDLAVDGESYLSKVGIRDAEQAREVALALTDADELNGSVVGKISEVAQDDKVTAVLKKSGLLKNTEDGTPSLSLKEFADGIKALGKNIRDGVDVEDSKKAIRLLLSTENSPFKKRNSDGSVAHNVSPADIIFGQIDRAGTSYKNAERITKPIMQAIIDSIGEIDKKISVYEQTKDLAQGIRDIKTTEDIAKNIISQLIPNFEMNSIKGKNLGDLMIGAIKSDKAKVEKVFKSKEFKSQIQQLRALNDKYKFLEDDSLFYNLDIDNLMNAEKQLKDNIKAQKDLFEVNSKASRDAIDGKMIEMEESVANEIKNVATKGENIYAETLAEIQEAKRIELENNKEIARAEQKTSRDSLQAEIESDVEAGKLSKTEIGKKKRKLALLNKDILEFDSKYDAMAKKTIEDLSSPRNKDVFPLVNERKAANQAELKILKDKAKAYSNYKAELKKAVNDTIKAVKKITSIEDLKNLLDEDGNIKSIKAIVDSIKSIDHSKQEPGQTSSKLPDVKVSTETTVSGKEFNSKWGVEPFLSDIKEFIGDPKFYDIMNDYQKYIVGEQVNVLKRRGFSDNQVEKFLNGDSSFTGNYEDLFKELGYSASYTSQGGANTTHVDLKKLPELENVKKLHADEVSKNATKVKLSPKDSSLDLVDVELSKIMKELKTTSQIKDVKSLSADEAIEKVSKTLQVVMDKSKTVNEKVKGSKVKEIQNIKKAYARLSNVIKENSKKDFTNVFEAKPVQDAANNLIELVRRSGISDIADDIIPQDLITFHGKILDSVKQSMDRGTVLKKGEKVVRAKSQAISRDSLRMAKLGMMINKRSFLNDKSYFDMRKMNHGVERVLKGLGVKKNSGDYSIEKVVEVINNSEGSPDLSNVKIEEIIRPELLDSFKKLYENTRHLFAEVIDETEEVRDLDMVEFAVHYWNMLRDLQGTRASTARFDPSAKKSMSEIIPYFKDQDSMIEFFTIDNASYGRTGYVKSNFEALMALRGIAEKGGEYNSIGMSTETLESIMRNSKSSIVRDAMEKMNVEAGESKDSKIFESYYDNYSDLLSAAFSDPEEAAIPKIISLFLNMSYTESLFGSGVKEYPQTLHRNAQYRTRYLTKGQSSISLAKDYAKGYPRSVAYSLKAVPIFAWNMIKLAPKLWNIYRGNIDMNKELSKMPTFKSKNKYVNKIMEHTLSGLSMERHLQNADGTFRIQTSSSSGQKFEKSVKNIYGYYSEMGFYLQQHNEIVKEMLSHETAYDVMREFANYKTMEDIPSKELLDTLRNLGVNEEAFQKMKSKLSSHTDVDGAIDLDFYDSSKMRTQIGDEDQHIGQMISNTYTAIFHQENTLRKADTFKVKADTVMDKLLRFLKNTTTNIANEDLFHTIHTLDDHGNYVNRISDGFDRAGIFGAAKEGLKTANYLHTQTALYGVTALTGNAIALMVTNPLDMFRKISEFVGSLSNKNDDDIDDTSAFSKMVNFYKALITEGAAQSAIAGTYLSGGNVFKDQVMRVVRSLSKDPDKSAYTKVTEFFEEAGIPDTAMTRKIFTDSLVTTLVKMNGAYRFIDGKAKAIMSAKESVMEEEIRHRKNYDNIERNLKDSPNQIRVAKKTYNELVEHNPITKITKSEYANAIKDSIHEMVATIGSVFWSLSDSFREDDLISDDDYYNIKTSAHEMMGINSEVYDKFEGDIKKYGDGLIKFFGTEDKLAKEEFKLAYSQRIIRGDSPKDIAIDLIAGAGNAPAIMMDGQKAYDKSQKKAHDEISKNYKGSEEDILKIVASSPTPIAAVEKASKELEPKSKEAKALVSLKTDASKAYELSADALNVIDRGGRGIFTPDYLQSKGISKPIDQVTEAEKQKLLMEDYYIPMMDTIKKKDHLQRLFAPAVAVGAPYVQNVYDMMNGNVDKTLEYIYQSRLANRDVNGDLGIIVGIKPKTIEPDYHAEALKYSESAPEQIGESSNPVVNEILDDFVNQEGYGDDATNVKTGELGMTESRRKSIESKVGRSLTDVEAATIYIEEIYDKVTEMNPNLSEDAKQAVVSTAYNLGDGALKWKSFQKYISNPTDENLRTALFNSATIGGQTSKGLAKRRAEDYNKSNPARPVAVVEQKENGNLYYYDKNGDVLDIVVAKNGKHHKSAPGRIAVLNGKPSNEAFYAQVDAVEENVPSVNETSVPEQMVTPEVTGGEVYTPDVDPTVLRENVSEEVVDENEQVEATPKVVQENPAEKAVEIQTPKPTEITDEPVRTETKNEMMAELTTEAIGKIKEAAENIAVNIGDNMATSQNIQNTTVQEIVGYVKDTADRLVEASGEKVEKIVPKVSEIVKTVSEKIGSKLIEGKDALASVVENLYDQGIVDSLEKANAIMENATPSQVEKMILEPDTSYQIASEVVLKHGDLIEKAVSKIKNSGEVIAGLKGKFGEVLDVFDDKITKGKDFIDFHAKNFSETINSLRERVKDGTSEAQDFAIDPTETLDAKKVLGTESGEPKLSKWESFLEDTKTSAEGKGGFFSEWVALGNEEFSKKYKGGSEARKAIANMLVESIKEADVGDIFKPIAYEKRTVEERLKKVSNVKLTKSSLKALNKEVKEGKLGDPILDMLEYVTANSKYSWGIPGGTGLSRTPEEQAKLYVKGNSNTILGGNHLSGNAVDLVPVDGNGNFIWDTKKLKPYIEERDNLIRQFVKETGTPIRIFHQYNKGWDLPHIEVFNSKNDPNGEDFEMLKQKLNILTPPQ